MDYISKYRRQLSIRIFLTMFALSAVTAAVYYLVSNILELDQTLVYAITAIVGLIGVFIATITITSFASFPIKKIEDVISYASNNNRNLEQPNTENLRLGRELITSLSRQVYDMASSVSTNTAANSAEESATPSVDHSNILDSIATPIYGVDSNQIVTMVNLAGANYINKSVDEIVGKPIYDSLNLSFQTEDTYSEWIKNVTENNVTASKSWDRVRHTIDEDTSMQFDMVASFSSGHQSGTESVIALFDKSDPYLKDDQDISYVALAVHELRTPLTIMRGYIEVFEDELGPTLNPELLEFMHKMHASAQQLAAFVSNILNVARVEENQLTLVLRSENWPEILKSAVADLQLRASVHGKNIDLQIAENIPPIAADRVSIHEVINNLVDNAIKYSGSSDKITIKTFVNSEGLVETAVQDYGIGIPASVMGNLFQKFHRSHKSSTQVVGTGLGLYLCKAMVGAHGGNIWVNSKEGEGSTFTFTLIPFDQLSAEQVAGEDGIIRGAHGWIKNHSLYRN
jgi:signal transduction histidine kinase